jgi:hypothetical protein
MSDGMSACASAAHAEAEKFAGERWPGVKVVEHENALPKRGKAVLIYEDWLDHVVEYVEDGKTLEAWEVGPNFTGRDRPKRLPMDRQRPKTKMRHYCG